MRTMLYPLTNLIMNFGQSTKMCPKTTDNLKQLVNKLAIIVASWRIDFVKML